MSESAASESLDSESLEFSLGARLTAERGGTVNRRLFSKPVFSLLADTPTPHRLSRRSMGKGKPDPRRKGMVNWSLRRW